MGEPTVLEPDASYFGGTPVPVTGTQYQISYYGEVPVFSDLQPSWT
jgi:hypothetical protein